MEFADRAKVNAGRQHAGGRKMRVLKVATLGPAMKEPEWHEVLEPREAIFAGIVGFAAVWPLVYYAYHVGYVFWGYSPPEWKNLGMAVDVLGFAVPYVLVKWVVKRR